MVVAVVIPFKSPMWARVRCISCMGR